MRRGQSGMTLPALLLGLSRGPEIVDTVTSGAVCRSDLGPRHNQRAVPAGEELLLLDGMASATEGWDFVRRGDTVRRDRSCRSAVLHAGTVAGVAAQAPFEMLVCLKIGGLLAVAWHAEFVSLLGQHGEREQQEQPRGHNQDRSVISP